MMRAFLCLMFVCAALSAACGQRGARGRAGQSCSVRQSGADVMFSCDDGSHATIHAPTVDAGASGACNVSEGDAGVTIRCPDGSHATIPVAQPASDAGSGDAGQNACSVSTDAVTGAVTIHCPDGSSATIPGSSGSATHLLGATAASCGTCHDSSSARAHFQAQSFASDAGPVETCGTCHREGSIEPVSVVHARAELGLPGLSVTTTSASVDPATHSLSVRFSIADGQNAPLARDGVVFNFVIAKVGTEAALDGSGDLAGPYQSYLTRSVTQQDNPDYPLGDHAPRVVSQPTSEAGTGSFTLVSPGVYDYVFKATLPSDDDGNATHFIGLYATRTVDGVRFVANSVYFFVPNQPSAQPEQRDAVHTESCNQCHNPLSAHGGARKDVQLCLGCHTGGAIDPESGNSLDFNVMIHRIHRGKDLPSVVSGGKYGIVGYGNHTSDYSHVGYPQPDMHCQSCHAESDGSRWLSNGSRKVCTSCHENIDLAWKDGGHPFPLSADATCTNGNCHGPYGKARNVQTAHLTFLSDSKARVLTVSVLSVSAASADDAPRVTIRVATGTRAIPEATPVTDANQLSLLTVFVNGPNQGFLASGNTLPSFAKQELVGLLAGANPGEFSFSLPKSLRQIVQGLGNPETDSYTLSVRATYDPTPAALPDDDRLDNLHGATLAFTVGEELSARRTVVLTSQCNRCHGDLRMHAGERFAKDVEQCAMCHTGSLDTRVRQGANTLAGPTRSLRFSTLVHRIHGSGIATAKYVLFGDGDGGAPFPEVDFSALPFPGDLRDCTSCHAPSSYFLPLPADDPPTATAVLDADGHVIGP